MMSPPASSEAREPTSATPPRAAQPTRARNTRLEVDPALVASDAVLTETFVRLQSRGYCGT